MASFAIAANAARANAPRAGLLHLSCKGDGSSGQERGWLKGALAATAAALVLATAGFVPAGAPPSPANVVEMVAGPPKASNAFVEASDRKLEPSEKNTIQLFRENTPSVVFISTYIDRQDRFSLDVERVPQGQGSGFVWDKEGHIVTNYHVIRSATAASVALSDTNGKQTLYKATLVGVDPDKDTAVLKIDAPSSALRPIVRGTSSDLQVGQMALAIGNPFGLDHSLSTGVVSGLGRETASPTGRAISNVIQTDAAINPGNSGGALLDSQGALIGMNTAIYSPSGASSGVGFAIPVDTVKAVVTRLISTGAVARPVLGVSIIEGSRARQLGLQQGVLILDAPPGSPAAKAGLRGTARTAEGIALGDIIIGIDDTSVKSEVDLLGALEQHQPGDAVSVKVLRGRADGSFQKFSVEVRLAEGPRAVAMAN